MNRKLLFGVSLLIFFILWGVFGFTAAAPQENSVKQGAVTAEQNNPVAPKATVQAAAIPVTGDPMLETEVLLTYVIFGLGALGLILALLHAANKPGTTSAHPQEPPDESS
jgi:hypothetical protein